MKTEHTFDHTPYLVAAGEKVDLSKFDPGHTAGLNSKKEARKALEEDIVRLNEAQQLLWASKKYAVLIILQALDAAGKDGTIKHVMTGVNPQGCHVYGFKAPSEEELQHHFLWRPMRFLPPRGSIAIFNRSYYEEVLVVRVHPGFLKKQHLPPGMSRSKLWESRFDQINQLERTLVRNGTVILKFFLNVSKAEQKVRFLERLNRPDKHWKFSVADVRERGHWSEYQEAYRAMLEATSTEWAPWYVVPADRKWFTRAVVADIISTRIGELGLKFPTVTQKQLEELQQAKQQLEQEKA